MRFIFI